MGTLISNYYLKIIKDKANGILIGLLFVSLLFPLFFYNHYDPMFRRHFFEENLRMKEEVFHSLEEESEGHYHETSLRYLRELLTAMNRGDVEGELIAELNLEKTYLEETIAGRLIGYPVSELEKNIAYLSYLVDEGIERVHPSQPYPPASNYWGELFLSSQQVLTFLMINALLFSNLFTSDKRHHDHELTHISPVPLWKSLVASLFANFSFIFASWFVVISLATLIAVSLNGLGAVNYPVAILRGGDEVAVISVTSFVMQNLLFVCCWLLLLGSLSFLLSLVSSNFMLNLVGSIVILSSNQYTWLRGLIPQGFQANTPFFYVDFSNVIIGGTEIVPLPLGNLTVTRGVSVLLGYSLCVLLISVAVVKYRKRL